MIGWDEILQGGLAPRVIVMSWRGEEGGIEAARPGSRSHHDAVRVHLLRLLTRAIAARTAQHRRLHSAGKSLRL